MSPVPVTCLIEKEVVKNSGNIPILAQSQNVITQDTVFDASAISLVITPDDEMAVGSLATLELNISSTPEGTLQYQREFK